MDEQMNWNIFFQWAFKSFKMFENDLISPMFSFFDDFTIHLVFKQKLIGGTNDISFPLVSYIGE